MESIEVKRPELEKIFCPVCDKFEWHVQNFSGKWECLGCWVMESPLEARFPHLFKDKEVI